jgi:hypothetical protein
MFLVLISVRTGACSDSKGMCITGALNRKHASGALLYSSTVSPLSNPAVLLLLIERPKRGPMGSYNRDPIPSAALTNMQLTAIARFLSHYRATQ